MHLAALALNLTMIIQLFHKTVLFNTKYGPKLEYFLLASSDVIESGEEEDPDKRSFVIWKENVRLVDNAELNTYTIDDFPNELIFLFGFMLLRWFRAMLKKHFFKKWEGEFGRSIYRDVRDIEIQRKEELDKK